MNNQKNDKSSWAIGGGVLAGVGAGFFFLETSAPSGTLAFVGSLLIGLGIGLIIAAIISSK